MRKNLVLVAAALVLMWSGLAAAGAPIASELTIDGYWFEFSQELNFTLSLTNTGSETIAIPRWDTPVDGIEGDILAVQRDGQPVLYTGRLYKRPEPTAADLLQIAPGETFTVTFDPSSAYDMAVTGEYSVAYTGFDTAVTKSSPVTLYVNGLDPATASYFEEKGKPGGGGGGGQFTNCTSTRQSQLLTAVGNATVMVDKAVTHLATYPTGSSLYTWWFGTYSSSRMNTVHNHFDSLKSTFHNAYFTFDCSCNQNAYAYVYPSQPYKIYLCKVYWTAPAQGRDSKAGTLIHETSHFNVVAGTQDYVYGATGAHNLAGSDPNKAVNNADNHEYFGEDQ